ncbi:tRNA-Thr(GGU) m(6)t(6)A37 methyltransferase TsaA [Shimia gijangensis]|uniref:tRNA-Thr(GGU) m(6)t(6)A37 methyltransferase TsaA n=1 Tax=Shimia gijangensis TaxID=1470563 RepID=A0A1M6CLI8_9RHOB|nr:SAM-dependent methyltransferase [Shimia gijangensis]SHI61793.1 tRNA-Thr(GGU) m(6)t(6)A37 methyltransferase TsaA [Shimia gijangensis]
MSDRFATRPGEVELGFDPAERQDALVRFIGKLRTPWSEGNCPKNVRAARESGQSARIELEPDFAPGLEGVEVGQGVILIYWMNHARRDLIRQAPRHVEGTRGTFALRSPVRPNPLAMSAVRITGIDMENGVVEIDAIDCFDGTPLVDIKPWIPTVDMPAEV